MTRIATLAAPTTASAAFADLFDAQSTDQLLALHARVLSALDRRGVTLPADLAARLPDELEQAAIEADARRNPVGFRRRANALGIRAA